ncbi:uncharacterized protein Eig71Ei [Drosophila takahashii]|uniref:uncharacterized protein Eig71Ei n=1 Tax=Drosophila takahashii TaxID=29030 RepID=UPI001CF8D2A2|nr:uncharacterized protein LOC108057892 [Drosophila takahashii]
MLKRYLALTFCYLLMAQVQGSLESERLHKTCMRIFDKCAANEDRLGKQDDTSKFFNEFCRRSDSNWSDVSRCDLLRVACLSTVCDCESPTCKNIAQRMSLR